MHRRGGSGEFSATRPGRRATTAAMRASSLRRLSRRVGRLAIVGCIAGSALGSVALGCSEPATPPATPRAEVPEPFGPLGERDDLPVAGRIALANLEGPVDVVRDVYGRPHVYATSVADAMRVEGHLVARDRTLQLELLRRLAAGRLAEILGEADPSTIDVDIAFRHARLARVAKAQYEALPPGEIRAALEAYADGVTQAFRAIRDGTIALPDGVFGIPKSAFTDWSPVDSLAVARLQTYLLSYDADADIRFGIDLAKVREAFAASSPDPLAAKRAGIERDLFRFAPFDPTTIADGYPSAAPATGQKEEAPAAGRSGKRRDAQGASPRAQRLGAKQLEALSGRYLRAVKLVRDGLAPDGFGSNNWVVAPSRSASGHTLLASDPHLSLTAPAVFYPVSIDVDPPGNPALRMRLGGVTFPGIPGIVLGHNERVAWGATVAGYDVSDAYVETLTPSGDAVLFEGKPVALETIDEVIAIQGRAPYTYRVRVVPHHGPIQPDIAPDHTVRDPDPKKGAISIRWTGHEATTELEAIWGLFRARDANEARASLEKLGVGAQNWVIGDVSGNVVWTTHADVPVRDRGAFDWNAATYEGTLPCLPLPGDGSAEWKGRLPSHLVPWAANPLEGFFATANNDPIGDTLDNDPTNDALPDGTPMFLACRFDIGFRAGRIRAWLAGAKEPIGFPDEMAAMQADARSPMGAALVPHLLGAIQAAFDERTSPGSHPGLSAVVAEEAGFDVQRVAALRDLFVAWAYETGYWAAAGVDLDTNEPLADLASLEVKAAQATLLFNTWLVRLLARTLDDELAHAGGVVLDRGARARAILRLAKADPSTLATYDPSTLDSALWDDMQTPEVETRHERMIRALLDADAWLSETVGADPADWRWGALHTVRFEALVPLFGSLSIPPASDPTFPRGFPRPGDCFGVDSSDFSLNVRLDEAPSFAYAHGPAQRFVVELDPAGPKAWNALPGGAVWDAASPHFRDEAELWRKNYAHPVPFLLPDVIAAFGSRTVVHPPPADPAAPAGP